MQITITARHFGLTNAIREYVEEASDKLTKYFDHIINVHFILSLENNRNTVEVVLHAPKHNFTGEATENDMYVAVDAAVDKIEHQIKKLKDKWSDHQKRSLKDNAQFVYANLIERKDENKRVKIKRMVAEALSFEEAFERFDNIKDSYFIFKNEETDRINVLVRKDEDHIKLLEP